MEWKNHYGTITEAIYQLKLQGFNIDFNLEENNLLNHIQKFPDDKIIIADIYRYEGDTDPADEAIVYAISLSSGLKGILVDGYGSSSDSATNEIIKKLNINAS